MICRTLELVHILSRALLRIIVTDSFSADCKFADETAMLIGLHLAVRIAAYVSILHNSALRCIWTMQALNRRMQSSEASCCADCQAEGPWLCMSMTGHSKHASLRCTICRLTLLCAQLLKMLKIQQLKTWFGVRSLQASKHLPKAGYCGTGMRAWKRPYSHQYSQLKR